VSYPAITAENAQKYVDSLKQTGEGLTWLSMKAIPDEYVTMKNGPDFIDEMVATCAIDERNFFEPRMLAGEEIPRSELYALEARMASHIHSGLSFLSLDLLEDEGFWRYLALGPFLWYLLIREPELQPQDFGGLTIASDREENPRTRRANIASSLVFRTFLWGKIAYDRTTEDSYRRATVISDKRGPSIDVWHSHLLRTQLGQIALIPHSFIDVLVDEITKIAEMKDVARWTEKYLNRMKHGVLYDVLDATETRSVVSEQLAASRDRIGLSTSTR
jgi:Family of unknown function (DUF6339)